MKLSNGRVLLASALASAAAVGALAAAPGTASAAVTVDGDNASLDTFTALNAVDEDVQSKNGDDFISFSESLAPAALVGAEGRAKSFVSLAAALITSSQPPFPLAGIDGFVVDGRLLEQATKTTNPAPGVPVASSEGFYEVEFDATAATPYQFAGALQSANDDSNDCTEISVELLGPVSHTFEASAGGDCPSPLPDSRGFVITDSLPAGSYNLEVEYGSTIDPEDPGSESASGAVDMSLAFFPPNTRLTRARINRGLGKATFRFKKVGEGSGFQCALYRPKRAAKFKRCSSPRKYKRLKPGKYVFEVRVVGPVAPDATPSTKSFRIPKRG